MQATADLLNRLALLQPSLEYQLESLKLCARSLKLCAHRVQLEPQLALGRRRILKPSLKPVAAPASVEGEPSESASDRVDGGAELGRASGLTNAHWSECG